MKSGFSHTSETLQSQLSTFAPARSLPRVETELAPSMGVAAGVALSVRVLLSFWFDFLACLVSGFLHRDFQNLFSPTLCGGSGLADDPFGS